MVHYQSPCASGPADRASDATDYWKLKNHDVQELTNIARLGGYQVSLLDSTKHLRRLVERIQRGLPCYDGLTISSFSKDGVRIRGLRYFCRKRGLPLLPGARTKDMICALEKADERATFINFHRLPRRVRHRIYHFHFLGFHGVDVGVEPPPITEVVGEEALELWYEMTPLYLDIRPMLDAAGGFKEYALDRQSLPLPPSDRLARIRRIELTATQLTEETYDTILFAWTILVEDGTVSIDIARAHEYMPFKNSPKHNLAREKMVDAAANLHHEASEEIEEALMGLLPSQTFILRRRSAIDILKGWKSTVKRWKDIAEFRTGPSGEEYDLIKGIPAEPDSDSEDEEDEDEDEEDEGIGQAGDIISSIEKVGEYQDTDEDEGSIVIENITCQMHGRRCS